MNILSIDIHSDKTLWPHMIMYVATHMIE